MMNVLYLINHAGKAGTEKYVYNLVCAYNKKRCNCFFAYNEEGQLSEQMRELGIKSFRIDMKNPFDLVAAKKLAKICKENKIDIIHTQYPRENYIAILSRIFYKKTKVIYTCHLTLKTNFLWKITNKIIIPHQEKILSVCNDGKRLLIGNGVNEKKIDVIFNGIFCDEEKNVESNIRKELSIDDDTFVICTLARYHIAKGLDYFVKSIKRLCEKTDRKFVVLIAGDGELFGEIKALIAKLGLQDKVLQLGYRTDSENILYGSDIFVNSAKCYEALSFAILEALGAGLPVVATNVGGNSDIINSKTDCGYIVEYNNEEEMANAILKLMEDKDIYNRFQKNSTKAIKEVFNLRKLLDDIYEEYEKAIK